MKKSEIMRIVSEAAKKYDELFNAQNTFIVYGALNSPLSFETKAIPENFLHLTGLKVNIPHILRDVANKNQKPYEVFYEKALHGKLVEDDFDIKNNSTEEKLSVLVNALDITSDNRKVGRLNNPHTKLDADILIGNGAACLGFVKVGENYIPKTVLKSSINKETCGKFTSVRAILNKGIAEKEYNKIVFADKIDLDKLLKKINNDVQIAPKLIAQVSLSVDKASIIVNDTLNELKKLRQERIKGKSKVQKTKAQKAYQAKLKTFEDKDKYSTEILSEIVDELRKRAETAKDAASQIMRDDIKCIDKIIKQRIELERSSSNLDEIKSPTSVLSTASSTLADDSDSGSNNTQKISLEPPRKQLFNVAQPVFSGQAAGAIALPFPSNLPPLFDISKIIIALQALNEKITNAIHTFTDSFSLSHAPKQSTQEQPPQARTAHERKINTELPFPKEKPLEERTEPITAKPEKRDVKSAEKQSSWIGSLLNSAKSEADEHNKNHEPKAHDKDKSL